MAMGVGVGVAVGVGVGAGGGYPEVDICGGVAYGLGPIDPIIPVELNGSGGFATLTTPIVVL